MFFSGLLILLSPAPARAVERPATAAQGSRPWRAEESEMADRIHTRSRTLPALALVMVITLVAGVADGITITEIINSTGDGGGNTLDRPSGVAVDDAGNVYVAGESSDNGFRIDPNGVITEIIDSNGDGLAGLGRSLGITVDGAGNAYVAGVSTDNVFRIDPNGVITEIIDSNGDGLGNKLWGAIGLALDQSGNLYVSGVMSHNVFALGSTGTIIMGVVTDGDGSLYVTGRNSHNAFHINPAGLISQIIDPNGDGAGHRLRGPHGIAVDAAGNVYIAAFTSNNGFKIEPGGAITEIIDPNGDGAGHPLEGPLGIAATPGGTVYIVGNISDNVFRIEPGGAITQIMDSTGNGAGHTLIGPIGVALDTAGNLYVTARDSDNGFKVEFCGDGVIAPGEECDDGNTLSGDGCSSVCQVESQPQNREQQKCINALNKSLARVARVQGKELCACIKEGAKGELEGTIEDCLMPDVITQKVTKAIRKTVSAEDKKCSNSTPDFGATDSMTVNLAAMQKEIDLVREVFGPDLDEAIFSEGGNTEDSSKCQQLVAGSVEKCQDAKLKEFNRCKKDGLKDERIQSSIDLESCMGRDSNGKIAKACAPASGTIRKKIDKKCAGKGVDLSDAFAGCDTDDPGDLATCLDEIVECQVCLALNEADALDRDCDDFDDDVINESCP
jgi:cysteine-rich repeat protein